MTNWKVTEPKFKKLLEDYDNPSKSLATTIKAIANLLRTSPCYSQLPKEVIESLEDAKTEEEANEAIERVYDYADEHRIWLGF